jgi:excisionase family DNA binding protein
MREENDGGKRLNKMLTVDDIADIFKVHPCTIRRWEKQGRLKSYRLSDHACLRFKREEISNFIESSRKRRIAQGITEKKPSRGGVA